MKRLVVSRKQGKFNFEHHKYGTHMPTMTSWELLIQTPGQALYIWAMWLLQEIASKWVIQDNGNSWFLLLERHWGESNASVVSVPSAGSQNGSLFPVLPLPSVSAGGPQPLTIIDILIVHCNLCSQLSFVSFFLRVFSLLLPSKDHSHSIGCPS